MYSTSPTARLKGTSLDDFGGARSELAPEDGGSPLKYSTNSAITPYYNKTYGN